MRACALILFTGLALAPVLAAQEPEPAPPVTVARAAWRSPIEIFIGPSLRMRLGVAMNDTDAALPDGGPMARRPAAATVVSFRPGPQRLVPERIAAGMKGLDAKGRKAAAQSFRDLISAYEQEAPKHDVAHALAFCLGTCQQVARGKEMSILETQALSRRAAGLLPGLPEFAALQDRDRQAMYESLIVTGGIVGGLAKQAEEQGESGAARQAKVMARHVLALFGMAVQ